MARPCGAWTPTGPCQREIASGGSCGVRHTAAPRAAEGLRPADASAAASSDPLDPPRSAPADDFTSADLRGRPLAGRDLPNTSADFSLASGVDARGANFTRSSWRGANLTDACIAGTDWTQADLTGARLPNANARNAIFAQASVRGADLSGADLVGTDLRGADLSGADLCGADLTGATHDHATQWELVTYSQATRMPDGVTLPPSALRYDPPTTNVTSDEGRTDQEMALIKSVERVAQLHRKLTPLTRRSVAAASATRPMPDLAELEGIRAQIDVSAADAQDAWRQLRERGY